MCNIRRIWGSGWRYGILINRVRRIDKFIFLFSLFYVFLFLDVNTLTNGLDFLFTIPFNFLGVYGNRLRDATFAIYGGVNFL